MTTRCAAFGRAIAITMLGLGFASPNPAATPTNAQAEVEYLLGAVADSGCQFNRNGDWYDAKAASAHLRAKYNSLVALGRFATAMDFIEEVATKSSLSGQAYLIRCASAEPLPTNQWLREALARFRLCSVGAGCKQAVIR
jgi:hypothetical protein